MSAYGWIYIHAWVCVSVREWVLSAAPGTFVKKKKTLFETQRESFSENKHTAFHSRVFAAFVTVELSLMWNISGSTQALASYSGDSVF